MTDLETMLEAHVQHEIGRWRGEALQASVREEVEALFEWLDTVTVREVAPPATVARIAGEALSRLDVTDDLLAAVADAGAAAHGSLLEHDGRLGDVVAKEHLDSVVAVLVGMDGVRREVLEVVTTSTAYARLVAHVVYHGLKSYVLTENLIARKIPGASSLVRLGQRGLNSAVPGVEAGLDRQLTAFVQANITDTLRESRRYLDEILEPPMLTAMADEAWDGLVDRSVSSLAGSAASADVEGLVELGVPLLRQVRDAGLLGRLVETTTERLLEQQGDRYVGDVLRDLDLEAEPLVGDVVAVLGPALEHADSTGFLESRVRARLEPFYRSRGGAAAT